MNLNKPLVKNIILSLLIMVLIFAFGCSKSGVDLTQTLTLPSPSTATSQNKNNIFGYSVEIPNGWRIVKNDKTHLELTTIALNKNEYFINPYLSIFVPNIRKQFKEEFIKNTLKGTTSNIKLEDATKVTKFDVVAYECLQKSAQKEYPCYYAFITTDEDFIVMFLSGDMSIKEDLKSVFYNSLKTFNKLT